MDRITSSLGSKQSVAYQAATSVATGLAVLLVASVVLAIVAVGFFLALTIGLVALACWIIRASLQRIVGPHDDGRRNVRVRSI